MAIPQHGSDDEGDDPVFLDQSDVVGEVLIDEQDLPDAEEEEEEEEDIAEDEATASANEDNAIHVFTGHTESVYTVACSPVESKIVATGGGDDEVFIWKIGDEAPPLQLTAHRDTISALAFSASGQLLASGGMDGIVYVWETAGRLKHKLEGPEEDITWLCWHPRGDVILAGSQDFTSWMWNANSGICLTVFTGHSGAVTCGCFTPDGKLVCTGSADCRLRVWQPRTGQCIRVIQGYPFHTEAISCLVISRDCNLALTGSEDSKACLVNIQNGKVAGTLSGHTDPINSIALSPTLPLAATGGRDKKLIVWDIQTFTVRFTCEHEDDVFKIIWSLSEIIYTACLDGKVRAWDARTGSCQRIFQGHEDAVLDLALTCDGQQIVSGSDDKTARVFEV